MADAKPSKYVSLKDLASLPPKDGPSPPYSSNIKTRYVKIKKPLVKNGVRICWREVAARHEEDDYPKGDLNNLKMV